MTRPGPSSVQPVRYSEDFIVKRDSAESQKRRLLIQNYNGEKLVGILHDVGSTEIVIVCHGFQSSKERIPMVNIAAALEKDGINAFRFDFAGNGESEGSFQYGNYYREADDLRAVVQHFRDEKYVVTAIVGHSKGGNVVLLYASKYKDVHIVVNISARFNLARGMEGRLGKDFIRRIKQDGFIDVKNKRVYIYQADQYVPLKTGKFQYRVTEESLLDRLSTDTAASCLLIPQDCRVMTVHGSMDQIVPTEDASDFARLICNHQLRIIGRADHEYTFHQDELTRIVMEFIKSHLDKDRDLLKQSPLGRVDKPIHSRF